METLERFAALLGDVGDGLLFGGWISAAIALCVGCALGLGRPWQDPRFRRLLSMTSVVLIVPLLLIMAAAAFANEDPYREVSPLRATVVQVVWMIYGVLALSLVVVARGYRIRFLAFLLGHLWLGFWVALVAAMSLTGNWL